MRELALIGADRPGVGVMTIREVPGGLFEPSDKGQPHLVLPVCHYRAREWLGIDLSQFEPIDLIAMKTSSPERWLWRTGDGWALGVEHLGVDAPLRVVATPLDWIAAEGRALCILDWAAPGWCWELVRSELQLILPDYRLRQRLMDALVRHSFMPDNGGFPCRLIPQRRDRSISGQRTT